MDAAYVAALFGFAGVLVGSAITYYGQRANRRNEWRRSQLEKFYAPLLGMRAEIRAKSELRLKLDQLAGHGFPLSASEHESLLAENNRQLFEELLPLYRKMVKHFADNIGFAESTTRTHFSLLVEFVEIWNRHEKKTIPAGVLLQLKHEERALYPFYGDLDAQVERLSSLLKRG